MMQLSEWHQSLQSVEANVKTKWCTLCSSNPLVPVNEVTSSHPSWATRETNKFKWVTASRVYFSIGQDPHCISRVGLILSQLQTCLSPNFLPIKLWLEAYSYSLSGWWGRYHPHLKYKKTHQLPGSAAECTPGHSNRKNYIYILVYHLCFKNII